MAKQAATNSIEVTGEIRKPFTASSVLILSQDAGSEKDQRKFLFDFFSEEFPVVSVYHNEIENLGEHPLIIILHRPRGIQ